MLESTEALQIWESRNGDHPDMSVEYYPLWKRDKVYVCPRNISAHRGKGYLCGKACDKVQGDEQIKFEEEKVFTVLVRKRLVIFDDF